VAVTYHKDPWFWELRQTKSITVLKSSYANVARAISPSIVPAHREW